MGDAPPPRGTPPPLPSVVRRRCRARPHRCRPCRRNDGSSGRQGERTAQKSSTAHRAAARQNGIAAKQALVCPFCGTVAPCSRRPTPRDGASRTRPGHGAARTPGTSAAGKTETRLRQMPELPGDLGVRTRRAWRSAATSADRAAIVPVRADQGADPARKPAPVQDRRERRCGKRIRHWYGTRWFAPNRFKSRALTDTVHGFYLPYWTFDAQVAARLDGRVGLLTTTRPRRYRDSKGNTQTRQVQHTRWQSESGRARSFLRRRAGAALRGECRRTLLRNIEPFPTDGTRRLRSRLTSPAGSWSNTRSTSSPRPSTPAKRWMRSCASSAPSKCPATRTAICRSTRTTAPNLQARPRCRCGC